MRLVFQSLDSFPIYIKGCAFFETNNIKQLKTQNKKISRKKHVDPQKKQF